jgi:hypothetical protein
VKIQDLLYQPLAVGAQDFSKKGSVPLIERSETTTDSYALGTDFGSVKKEVFQVLKAIIGDLKSTIDRLHGDDHNSVFPDIGIRSSEKSVSFAPQHTIIVLFLFEKGEIPDSPVKVFLSYNADKSSSEITLSSQLVGKVVEEAGKIAKTLPGKSALALHDTKGEGTDTIGAESGFVFEFSHAPHASGKATGMPQLGAAMSAQRDEKARAPEWVSTYHVSGKTIDSQYLNLLSLHTGEESEVFEKLQAFISGIKPDEKQAEGNGENGILQKDPIAEQIGNIENAVELKKMSIELPSRSIHKENSPVNRDKNIEDVIESKEILTDLPLQSGYKENNLVIVPLDIQKIKDEAALAAEGPATKTSGSISGDEGSLRGTALNTGFGRGELKSSLVAGFPLLSFDNNVIISKIVTFVERLNILLSGDGTTDEASEERVPDGTASPAASLEKLRLLSTRSHAVRDVIQDILKRVFGELEETPGLESIGLSFGKNGSLRFDPSILISQLTSNKEETINVMKGLGNTIYERTNYLIHPYSAMYIDDKDILQLSAARKDEGASLPERELNKEQSKLEKRLNELKLLIERSRLLTEWFTKNENISADDPEEERGSG